MTFLENWVRRLSHTSPGRQHRSQGLAARREGKEVWDWMPRSTAWKTSPSC